MSRLGLGLVRCYGNFRVRFGVRVRLGLWLMVREMIMVNTTQILNPNS